MLDIQPFIDYLQKEKRSSNHTVIAYQGDLTHFVTYMKDALEIDDLSKVTANDIRTWILTLLEDDQNSGRTVTRKLSSLKAFYKYELKMGKITSNPMNIIQAPSYKKRLPVYVEQKDMEKLFNSELFPDSFEGLRDQTIIEMFYATGIRLSEMLNIQHQDINFAEKSIKVLGKRNKERIIPFGNHLSELLTKYLEYYQKNIVEGNKNNYIFVTGNGKKLYPKAVYRIVRKYLDMVTTIDKRSPHVIRHTFATHMLNNGADLNAIKEILGHSSLAATQVYTHNSIEQLKSIYKQAHPRA